VRMGHAERDHWSFAIPLTFFSDNKREREGRMSQTSSEKYLYFTVGLLKGSVALDALRQDATKHHMVDQPGQLIALRLTEYYEMMNQGIVQPVVRVPAVLLSVEKDEAVGGESSPPQEQITAQESPTAQRSVATPLPLPTPTVIHAQNTAPVSSISMPSVTPVQNIAPVSPVSTRPHLHPVEDPPVLITGRMRALCRENDEVVGVSAAAEQNADDAADYWSIL
jgi:hypothetical protein